MTYNNQETAMEARKPFLLPDNISNDFSDEELEEDYEGLNQKIQRVKIPGGGTVQFEFPGSDPDNPEYAKTLEGVILYNHPASAYWPEGSDYDDNVAPLCSSVDGKTGYGEPGGSCELCPWNKYGTGTDSKGNPSKGKACKNMRHLYLLQSGAYLPVLLALPPTSLKSFNEFMNVAFIARRRPTWGSVVQISLRKIENGANTYSVASFKKLYDFEGEQLAQVKRCAGTFREQIKKMLLERAIAAESSNEPDQLYEADANYKVIEDGRHFSISAPDVIDGEREELPA